MSYPIPSVRSQAWEISEVVVDLLARGRASRLYSALVRTGFAQEANAWTYPLVDDPARLTVDVTSRPTADIEAVAAVVLEELERLGEVGPSEPELDRVRRLRRTEHAADMEQTQVKADRIGMYTSLLGTPERVVEELERYEAVDGSQVRDFVSRFVTPDRRVELTYVPQRSAD